MSPTELEAIVDRLAALGEDREELDYWLLIYDTISEEARASLDTNLRKELATLEELAKKEVLAFAA
jgi:hypothetical protein